MLSHIIDVLADPADGSALSGADDFTRLVSESGHSYDVAKQGYVTLASGAGLKHKGDDADMVTARETYLSKGHFAPFVEAVTGAIQNALDNATAEVNALNGQSNPYNDYAIEGSEGNYSYIFSFQNQAQPGSYSIVTVDQQGTVRVVDPAYQQ